MKAAWVAGGFAIALSIISACTPHEPPPAAGPVDTAGAGQSATVPATFVNRVWTVAESAQVAPGSLRVFLSDGTLVMASPHATPAFGRWRYRDGDLTITEEGQRYPVDILALNRDTFRIRVRGPGEPVEIRFAPAAQPALPDSAR